MRVAMVYNPRSGKGSGQTLADSLIHHVHRAGHDAIPIATCAHPDDAWNSAVRDACAHAGALVIIGGDGTVRTAITASGRSTPVYHAPAGTENLFARQFGADATPARLLAALARRRIARIDLGRAETLFTLMTSAGPDAGVLNRLHATRGAGISHATYGPVILREYLQTTLPHITIDIDGQRAIDHQQGWAVVAVSRLYAFEVNPCPDAHVGDGLLDIAFFPATSPAAMLKAMVSCMFRMEPRVRRFHGRHVRISSDAPLPFQSDGDWLGYKPSLDISILPKALPVLCPA